MIGRITSANAPSMPHINALQDAPSRQSTGTGRGEVNPVKLAAERAREETGIVATHLVPLQEIAAQTNSIIGVRPVETIATGLIEAGHPTKDLHIKGKSANWGPQAGLICRDQAFSKLEKFQRNDADRVASANNQVEKSINEGYAVAVPLEVSYNRLDELVKLGKITKPEEQNGKLLFSARGPSQQLYTFEGTRSSPSEQNYLITQEGKKVEVLAKEKNGKALTADYDLHMVAPHISNFGPDDRLPLPDVAHSVFTQKVDRYKRQHSDPEAFQVPMQLRADYESSSHFYDKADHELGNVTPRIKQMIEQINDKLVGNGERVVHHSTDTANPVTEVAANYPATFFLPTKLGQFDEVCIIHDSKELAQLIKTAKDSGYQVPINPLWENEVTSIRRTGFNQARDRFSHG